MYWMSVREGESKLEQRGQRRYRVRKVLLGGQEGRNRTFSLGQLDKERGLVFVRKGGSRECV